MKCSTQHCLSIELALILENFRIDMHKEVIGQLLNFQVELLNFIGLNELEVVKIPRMKTKTSEGAKIAGRAKGEGGNDQREEPNAG